MDAALIDRIAAREEAHRHRSEAIHRAWRAYEGERPDRARADERAPDEIRLNLAGLIVDAGVDFLFGQDLRVEIDAEGTDQRDDWLAEAWGRRMMTTLSSAAIHGAVGGHAVLRIIPVDGVEPSRVPPRVIALDPANVMVIHAEDDLERVEAQVVRWGDERPGSTASRHRQVLEPQGSVWLITEQVSAPGAQRWTTTGEILWPHAWSPVAGCQNLLRPGSYWGRPDLTPDVLDTQDAVNDSLSRTARKDRLQNKRLIVGKGLSEESEGMLAEGDVVLLPDADSELTAIDAASGQVRDSLELYRAVKAALHEISRVPEIAAGRLDNVGQLSGLALQILYGPLIRKTESKRRTYGGLIADISARLLELGGHGMAADQKVALRWPTVMPTDDEAEARNALARQEAGVSIGTTLAEMGYDAAAEAEATESERMASRESAERAFDRGMDA